MTFTDADFAAFLKDISDPFLDGDITSWARRIKLPFSMVTATGPVTLSTPRDVEVNFQLYLKAKAAMHLSVVMRTPVSVEQCDNQSVIVTYKTELLDNGKRIVAPYTSSALLHFDDGIWKMSSIMNAIGHHRWTGTNPVTEMTRGGEG